MLIFFLDGQVLYTSMFNFLPYFIDLKAPKIICSSFDFEMYPFSELGKLHLIFKF